MRLIPRSLAAALLLLALAGNGHAQSADKILSEHVKALGGAKALRAVAGVRLTGEAKDAVTSRVTPFTLIAKSPDLLYLEAAGVDSGWCEAFNGRSAWRKDSSSGLRTLTGSEAAQFKATAFYWNDHFLSYKSQKLRPRLEGRDTLDDRAVYVISLTDRTGLQRKFFFDAASYMLLREQETGGGGQTETLFGDYRAIDGVQEPRRISLKLPGHSLEVTVRELTHNVGPEEQAFDFPRSGGALPDVAVLLEQVQKNQKKLDEIRHNYTCKLTQTQTAVDSRGRVNEKAVNTYELFFLGNEAVARQISKNGQPLSEKDQKKEQEKVDKAFHKYGEEQKKAAASDKPPSGDPPEDKDDITIRDFLNASHFYNPRRERFRGRDVIVFDFEPRPNYKPKNFGESIVQKLIGAVWIDDQAQEVARIEARTNASIKLGGGVLASLNPGAWFVEEQAMVNDEVWLPVYSEEHLSGRLLLFKSIKSDSIARFSDYKKFSVETKISAPTAIPPQP